MINKPTAVPLMNPFIINMPLDHEGSWEENKHITNTNNISRSVIFRQLNVAMPLNIRAQISLKSKMKLLIYREQQNRRAMLRYRCWQVCTAFGF